MFAQMRAFLAPPSFADEDQDRISRILNVILLAIVALLTLFLVSQFLTGAYTLQDTNFYILAGLEILVAGMWVALKRGYLRLAAYGVLFATWIGLVFVSFNAGGVRDSAFIALIVPSMIASLVLGWRQALYFLALTIAAGWLLAYLEDQGQILLEMSGSYQIATELTIVLLLFALLLYLLVSNLSNALAKARQSNEELRKFSDQLEERVVARTQELMLAANVAQSLSIIQDLESLLDNAVALIQSRFNLYYVQVYLLDESGEFLQLRAGTGDVGQALLQQKHRLRLDEKSINSTAVASKQPIIVADTSQSDIFQPNPLLPLTRSELAVPLILENQVVGVLNLQSSKPGSFTTESLPAFQTLAGQLAIAINNVNLLAEREQVAASLQEEQNRVQAILEAVSVPIVISFVSDGTVAYVNEALAEIVQIPRDELIGRQTPDFYVDPEDRVTFVQQLQRNGRVQNYEVQLKRGDGVPFWAMLSGRILDYQGQPTVLATLIDIDQRHKAEETIAQRAAQLQTVAQLSATANSILEEQKLLQEVVDLIKTRFGLYHAHVYLLDSSQENLVLAAGAGEIGRRMVAEKRSISLAQTQSLVARAARRRTSVIVNDVVRDEGFLPNPLLLETRAEMAVPMIAGQELIGVLDVQADRAGYFGTEDANIQTTLAAQVAIAIQNARSYGQMRQQAVIIENSGTMIVTTNMEGRVIYVNPAGLRVMGATIEVLQESPFTRFYTPESIERLQREAIPAMLKEGTWRGELTLVTLDGREIPVDQTISLIRSQEGRREFVAATMIDITEQKRAEAALQQALARAETFRRLVEVFNQGVAIAELDGAIKYANPALLHFWGFDDLTQVQGESITNFYPGDMRLTAELEAIPTTLERGVWVGEMILQAPDGREIPTLESYTLVTDEAGEPISLALVITDITERKEAEKAQQQLAAALEERLQEVNALQRAMTHEGWQAFFAAQERPIQGYRFYKEKLRLISRQDLHNSELTNAPMSATQVAQIVASDAETTAAVPMQIRGETIGILGARSIDGKPIDAKTRELLNALSAQVAEALERARLFEETELGRQQLDAQARELAVINEVAQSVSQLLQPADLLETIFRQVQRAITADAFIVATYDERTNTMNYPLVYDEGRRYQPVPGRPAADNPWLQVVQSGKPILINRTHAEVAERLAQLKGQAEQRLGQPGKVSASLMFVPLFLGQKTIGAMSVQSYTRAAYNERDLALLTGIANHVAVALENARLYTEAQRRAEREALVNTITQKIQSTLTVEKALETAVTELGRVFQAPYAAAEIALAGQENGRINPSHVKE